MEESHLQQVRDEPTRYPQACFRSVWDVSYCTVALAAWVQSHDWHMHVAFLMLLSEDSVQRVPSSWDLRYLPSEVRQHSPALSSTGSWPSPTPNPTWVVEGRSCLTTGLCSRETILIPTGPAPVQRRLCDGEGIDCLPLQGAEGLRRWKKPILFPTEAKPSAASAWVHGNFEGSTMLSCPMSSQKPVVVPSRDLHICREANSNSGLSDCWHMLKKIGWKQPVHLFYCHGKYWFVWYVIWPCKRLVIDIVFCGS